MNASAKQQRIEQFEQAHHESGLPITIQRRVVFEAILERRDHPTADQLYEKVRRELPQIARTSVYRILATFVTLGLISRICHPGAAVRFDPIYHQHHHLVCRDCGQIIDLEMPQLNTVSLPDVSQHEFLIDDYQIHFRGLCSRCRKNFRNRAVSGKAETQSRKIKTTVNPSQRSQHHERRKQMSRNG